MSGVPIGEIVAHVGGQYRGDAGRAISSVKSLAEAGPDALSFLSGSRYEHLLRDSRAAAVLVPENLKDDDPRYIRVRDPQLALAQVLQKWFGEIPRPPIGVASSAVVAPSATIGEGSRIGALAVIGERASIGRNVTIFDGCSIGPDAIVGDETLLYPQVTLYHRVQIGKRCILHAGVVIGSDGYGFATSSGKHHKIPQVGTVRIEDDVEIGAGSTVDRATLGETVIGEGTKIDNLVQIGHNVKIGRHCLIVAQVGIAGSAELGDGVVLAGQVGIAGHLKVGSGVKVAAQAAVMKTYEAGDVTLSGNPARPIQEQLRSEALMRRLPQLVERLSALEKEVAALKEKKN